MADLNDALYEKRSLVKHLAMRRTLWVFDPADLPAVQAAASDRVADTERRKLIADVAKAGVAEDGEKWLNRAAPRCYGTSRRTARPAASSCARPCPNWPAPTIPRPASPTAARPIWRRAR